MLQPQSSCGPATPSLSDFLQGPLFYHVLVTFPAIFIRVDFFPTLMLAVLSNKDSLLETTSLEKVLRVTISHTIGDQRGGPPVRSKTRSSLPALEHHSRLHSTGSTVTTHHVVYKVSSTTATNDSSTGSSHLILTQFYSINRARPG